MDQTPVSLLEQLRQPDPDRAWDRFVLLYTPLLYLWASRFGLDGPDADDLVQDVFTALVRDLPRFRYDPALRFRGWLWGVVRNKFRDRQRVAGVPTVDGLESVPDPAETDPGTLVSEAEYRQHLAGRALELMRTDFEPVTWQAFWQTAVDGRPAGAVAAELGVTENAVYLARRRVLQRLRAELAELLD